MFKPSIQQQMIDALEQENFVQEDFEIQEHNSILTFTYENHLDFTFSVDSGKTQTVTLGEKAFEITKCPGKYKNIEMDYCSIGSMKREIGTWLRYIQKELKTQREINGNEKSDIKEKKEKFKEEVDNRFENKKYNINERFSNDELIAAEENIDHWKSQVETILKRTLGDISTLQDKVDQLEKQLDSLKNDASLQTKKGYAKKVVKKLGLFALTYPAAATEIFNIINALTNSLGFENLLDGELGKTLAEVQQKLPPASDDEEEN